MDPAKSNQVLTLNGNSCCFYGFLVNFVPGKSVSANLENVIFKIFWGSMPPDPLESA